jgi:predicted CxxxxCH...CXXCH cytochrome family protein
MEKSEQFMKAIILVLFFFTGVIFLSGCSDLKNNSLPTQPALTVHPPEWTDTTSSGFHGVVLKAEDYDLSTCEKCHAKDFEGGTSSITCFTCHANYPHSSGWKTVTATDFHGKVLAASGWNLQQCQTCHGGDYQGVAAKSNVSCESSGCHVSANGNQKSPESCNTCHGTFQAEASDTLSWAPPRAVNGDTTTTSRGVGAHQQHLDASAPWQPVKCGECHTVPSNVFQSGHLDASASNKVMFNGMTATIVTANGTFVPHPSYDPATQKCSNTFCHGNWKALKSSAPTINQQFYADSVIVGNNYSPQWTGGSSEAACGTCHDLPPKGHALLTGNLAGAKCSSCHQGVVDANNNILNTGLHMNGKIDVFSTERDF